MAATGCALFTAHAVTHGIASGRKAHPECSEFGKEAHAFTLI